MIVRFEVRIAPAAEGDLRDIWDFIAKESPSGAEKFVSLIEGQGSTLERFPTRCPLIPENEMLGTAYRHLLFGEYRTIFKISGKIVYVLRILHGSRLLDDSLLGDNF